jgi:L-asparagine oxygenase
VFDTLQSSGILSIRGQLRNSGFVFLPSHLPGRSTEGIVRSLGTVIWTEHGKLVHQLKPKSADNSTPNTYSGIFGVDQFPLHTDLAHWRFPPRFVMLRCITGFDAVHTLLIDGARAIEAIDQTIFSRALVRPRRPIDGSLPLLRLYDRQQGDRGMLRWDEIFIRPASPAGQVGVTRLKECLTRSKPMSIPLANRGDTLIVDNWRMLHGRSPVPAACQGRVVERAYLENVF